MPRVFKNSVLIEPFSLDYGGFTSFLDDLAGSGIGIVHVVRRPGYTLVDLRGEGVQIAVAPFTVIIPPEQGDAGVLVAEKHVLQYYVNRKDSWLDYSTVSPAHLSGLLKQFESLGELRVSDWSVKASEASIECERVAAADYIYTSLAGLAGHIDFSESRMVGEVRGKGLARGGVILLGVKSGDYVPLVEARFDEKMILAKVPGKEACPGFWRVIHWLITDLAAGSRE
ncbi:MAG: hypothetical protein QXW58_01425 [Thermosphaera sp.]